MDVRIFFVFDFLGTTTTTTTTTLTTASFF
jgi:hypothetical protein